MGEKARVPVSKAALIARINRRLAQNGERLRASRGALARGDLGDYFIVDVGINTVLYTDVDPEILARQIEVLSPLEKLAE